MKIPQLLTGVMLRSSLPRQTLRLRLTLLYGALFLVSGAALLAVTYVLVDHATSGTIISTDKNGGTSVVSANNQSTDVQQTFVGSSSGVQRSPASDAGFTSGFTPAQIRIQTEQLKAQAIRQHAAELHQLLVKSGVALGVMALISIVLGWIVAGRVLSPLRTITATTRAITATNLNERLMLEGPDDEVKELGETINGLLARLEASFRSQRQFVANASHELRTPLARQRALIQVALADPDATVAALRAAHERVLIAEQQQERLIEALFTLTRGQAGLDRQEPLELATITQQVIDTLQGEVAALNLEITPTLAPARMMGDPRLIERLVANLVDNAIRYNTSPGRIQIATRTLGGQTTLTVSNSGPPIPAATIARLLQPFQRLGTERTHHGQGLGLGLSIVQAITDAHHAQLAVVPNPDGGLTATVTFASLRPAINSARVDGRLALHSDIPSDPPVNAA